MVVFVVLALNYTELNGKKYLNSFFKYENQIKIQKNKTKKNIYKKQTKFKLDLSQ